MRPSIVCAPNSRKKSALTWPDGTCSGVSPPVTFITPNRYADASCTTPVWRRHTLNFVADAAELEPFGDVFMNATMRSGSGNGTGFSSTVSTTEKMAVFAPMPSVSAATAAAVKPGVCRNMRSECFRSRKKSSIGILLVDVLDARGPDFGGGQALREAPNHSARPPK